MVEILSLVGALLSSLAAISSLIKVIRKERAERRFCKQLTETELEELENLLIQLSNDPSGHTKFREAQARIEQFLKSLDEADRDLLLEGLRQPSERGQENYTFKLLEEATAATGLHLQKL